MRPRWARADLDAEVVVDRFLGGADLDVLQAVLELLAPEWCEKLRVRKGPGDELPVDVGQPGALRAAVLATAGERGATYGDFVERYGRPPLERLTGSAELRGTGPELVVVVTVDQMVLSPLGMARDLGNGVALQVRRPKVEGQIGRDWLREAFETVCSELSPAWGFAGHVSEYWAKVMSDEPPIRAIGRDFGRFLPGVFWLNFFGRRCLDLVGEDRLLSTPAARLAAIDSGVLVELGSDPLAWDTPNYTSEEQRVRDHLGMELFFSKARPDRSTVVPDWAS